MFDLLIIMLERVGIIIAIAFILTRFQFSKNMFHHDQLKRKQELMAILFFGFFGIIGTYLGVALNISTLEFNNVLLGLVEDEAIANSRVIGVVIAGLLGGYRVGIGAGIIAGLHRMTLGGFTDFACSLSTIIAGVVAGAIYRKGKNAKPIVAFGITVLAETTQMGLILLFSKPFLKALSLVEVIGLPMILANGLGAALFMLIVHHVMNEEERVTAQQAQKTLRIADQTLSYLKKGLNNESALAVCKILYRELNSSAVAITSRSKVLAHIGIASDHHQVDTPIRTKETKDVIHSGELVVVKDERIHCDYPNCPLGAAIIVPLTLREGTIGTLKVYYPSPKLITNASINLISGLSSLLSNQLEIAEADKAYQLAKEAEIKVLQAQINPHFLFNSMNIIMSLIRTDPAQARKLLGALSYFLRQNVTATTLAKVSLEEELLYVKSYLEIIEARFIDRLKVIYRIDESSLDVMVPPFILQPIIENAIQHGINDKEDNCVIIVSIIERENNILITVEDNGKGIPPERLRLLGKSKIDSERGTGMGLFNVNRRLKMTFGNSSTLTIKSEVNKGTTVSFIISRLGVDA